MRVSPFPAMLLAMLASACGGQAPIDHQSEWRDVLRHKRAAVARDASPDHKQVYADSVRAFVVKHPNHSRATMVWQRLQLEFADDLAAGGRYQDAIRIYRSVLSHHPENDHARSGLALAATRLAVSREGLLALRKGMSHRQVATLLGEPMPGWSVKKLRAGATFEAWYYRMRSGSLAGVYFREGKVFAAEETSNQQLGRLGS
ncbi:MAG: outer membrane protein assembly factor BamE [Acidobacteriota bacterium]|nr:outer membrane protein assembly factor BamE [Acidobacteriota bacterium]